MIIKTLVENTADSEEYETEAGLSFYIETEQQKILFDLGKKDLFLKNAKKMDVEIADIDIVVISHGHFDHGGGLEAFMQNNSKAKIYIHKRAFDRYFAKRPKDVIAYIGLDERLKDNDRIVFTHDYLRINDEVELFSNVRERELYPQSNRVLLKENEGVLTEDSFAHEQNMIVSSSEKQVLFAGCAHNGITNIVKSYIKLKERGADVVIGGFHLHIPSTMETEDSELIKEIGNYLKQTGSVYYTCHCTGMKAFEILKEVMGEQVQYAATGSTVVV